MRVWCHVVTVGALGIVWGGAWGGCARREATAPPSAPVAVQKRAPNYQIFAPLRVATSDAKVPFLIQSDEVVVDQPCFQTPAEAETRPAEPDVEEQVREYRQDISDSLRSWLRDKVAPTTIDSSLSQALKIEPAEIVVRDIQESKIRFAENQECIQDESGWLETDVRPVVALYGAKTFHISSNVPIEKIHAEPMIQDFKAAGFSFETEDFIPYELVTDEAGQPQKGPAGEKLYRGPDGVTISANKMVPPEKQKLRNWTIKGEQPVFFAYRELSQEAYRLEHRAKQCDVNLVWGDAVFREPECPEFREVGFAAKQKGSQVEVQIAREKQKKTELMDFGEERRIQMDDRTILWIRPAEIEEGTLIELNSLVLEPAPLTAAPSE